MISGISSSTLALYAVVAISRMSSSGKPISGCYLANAFGLKSRTFEPLLQRLSKAGILTSVRGQSGGYLITNINELSVRDVLIAASAASSSAGCDSAGCYSCSDEQISPAIAAVSKVVDPLLALGHEQLLEFYRTKSVAALVNDLAKTGQSLLPEEWIDFSI